MGVTPNVPQEACAYIDESGAKGFVNAARPGEFGLLLAVVVRSVDETELRRKLDPAFQTFVRALHAGMKVHITDAIASGDAALQATAVATRDAFLRTANDAPLAIIYEAISATRFARRRDDPKALAAGAKATRRLDVRTTTHPHRDRLDEELFVGLCVKIDEYAKESTLMHVGLVSDILDGAIKDAYQQTLDDARDADDSVENVKGYDLASKRQVTATVRIKIEAPAGSGFEPAVTRLGEVAVETVPDPLLLLADILANGLRHHLAQRSVDIDPLNAPASVAGWPLESKVWGVMDNYIMDTL
jgi:hypothetical protein